MILSLPRLPIPSLPLWAPILLVSAFPQSAPAQPIINPPARTSGTPGGAKAELALPKDPNALFITYDPGNAGFIRKGAVPYLQIHANGMLEVRDLHSGQKKDAKLNEKDLRDLLRFIVQDNGFLDLSEAKLGASTRPAAGKTVVGIVVGDAGTATISVLANGVQHTVRFRAAGAYLQAHPGNADLQHFVAVEKRLSDLGASVLKRQGS